MKDRTPTKPGRVLITPEGGGTPYYAVMTMADAPTEAGDAPVKAKLLPDAVAETLGLDPNDNPQVKDALTALNTLPNNYARLIIKVATSAGVAISGVPVFLDSTFVGATDSAGKCTLLVTPGSHAVTVVQCLDFSALTNTSNSVTLTGGTTTTISCVATLSTDTAATITATQNIALSGRVSAFDVFLVGGGGSGAALFASKASAGGGAGGHTKTISGLAPGNYSLMQAVIGSGGVSAVTGYGGNNSGNAGGATYLYNISSGSQIAIDSASGGGGGTYKTTASGNAYGGAGGSGGGGATVVSNIAYAGAGGTNGGNGSNAYSSSVGAGGAGQGTTTHVFGSTSNALCSGGGGGAAAYGISSSASGSGGYGGGGDGAANPSTVSNITATSGTTYGGGGGGAAAYNNSEAEITVTSGAGYHGVVMLKWTFKED